MLIASTNTDIDLCKDKLVNSLLYFTRIFYLLRTGRKFDLSTPPGRESHYISICRALTRVLDGKCKRLIINVPPRYGKTELVIHFIAWALAQYPDSNNLYVSYSLSLAKKQTHTIRSIITMPEFKDLFNVNLKGDASAKDNYETVQGGSVYAAGAGGTITGRGAGIKGCNRFGGSIVIDDIHKPDEVTSDTIRQGIIDWYYNTIQSRPNSPNTPIIFIGQRLHEDDLASHLIETGEWETLIIPALDDAGNPLHTEMHDKQTLLSMKEKSPYEFAAQYQQNPQPAGGGIFKEEWFVATDYEPEILATFITADTAETEDTINDPTVFSFWGLYKIKFGNVDTGLYGLHWIDCFEEWLNPKDIENEFLQFYTTCMRHTVKPSIAAIEKKSTGVTLVSVLKKYQGLDILAIDRKGYENKQLNNKTNRFLSIQRIVASKQISLPLYAKHTDKCIKHCGKITANDTHRHDDIADTLYDAVKIALIDKVVINKIAPKVDSSKAAVKVVDNKRIDNLKRAAYMR